MCNSLVRFLRLIKGTFPTFLEYKFTPWSEWSSCGVTCGNATKSRSRVCQDVAYNNAIVDNSKCSSEEGAFTQQAVCSEVPLCPRDGGFTEWAPWAPCDAFCGSGNQTSRRFCLNPAPAFGGKQCKGENVRYYFQILLTLIISSTSLIFYSPFLEQSPAKLINHVHVRNIFG